MFNDVRNCLAHNIQSNAWVRLSFSNRALVVIESLPCILYTVHVILDVKNTRYISILTTLANAVVNVKCKLIFCNGTITKESCNWIEFISVAQCQMTPLKVWLHTARGCNHPSFACPSYNLDVWLLRCPNLRPWSQGWRLRSALRQRSSLMI